MRVCGSQLFYKAKLQHYIMW